MIQHLRAVFLQPSRFVENPKHRLEFEVTDVNLLPTHLVVVSPNNDAIRAQFITGWKDGDPVPHMPGIRFNTLPQK